MSTPLLALNGLTAEFSTPWGAVRAVDDVSFSLAAGMTLGIVGESGSGKSVTALWLMRLVRQPPGRLVNGSARYKDTDLFGLTDAQMRRIRGREIAMIFQEPMTSLNPVFRIGDQIAEVGRIHQGLAKRSARERAIEMLRLVHIPNPARIADEYPHRLSGGMRQRVMIAMALCCGPSLLIADEPTTALDVTIQAQILELLRELKERLGMAVLLITHDMGVIAENAQRVAVMYGGRIVEEADVDELFAEPLHPYTRGLLRSIPRVDRTVSAARRLEQIPGTVPTLRLPLPPGCRFAPRCSSARPECNSRAPVLAAVSPRRSVACYLHT